MRHRAVLADLRSSPGRRLVIALFAVPAILVGLLAMHVLTTGGMSGMGVPSTSATQHAEAQAIASGSPHSMAMSGLSPGEPSPADDGCSRPCSPSHDMLAMICVLALLVTSLLFTVQLVPTGWRPLKRVVAVLVASPTALSALSPPSLHVLSISRT